MKNRWAALLMAASGLVILAAPFSSLVASEWHHGYYSMSDSEVPSVAEVEAEVAEVRRLLAETGDTDLYPLLVQKLSALTEARYWEAMESLGEAGDEAAMESIWEESQTAQREEIQAVAREWIERAPEEVEGYLTLVQFESDMEARVAVLDRLMADLPDRVEGYEHKAELLRYRGEEAESKRLLEDFLAAHPDEPAAYKALLNHFQFTGNAKEAASIEAAWFERLPDSPEALLHQLAQAYEDEDPEVAAELSERLLAADLSVEQHYVACSTLVWMLPQQAVECLDRLAARDMDETMAERIRAELPYFLAQVGEWEAAEAQMLELMGPDEAEAARINVLGLLAAEGDCAAARELLATSRGGAEVEMWSRVSAVQALAECGEAEEAKRLLTELAQQMEAEDVSGFVYSLQEYLSAEEIEAILLARLANAPESRALHQALNYHYSRNAHEAKVMAHLLTWSDLDSGNAEPVAMLAAAFAEQGQMSEAISWQQEAVRRAPDEAERKEGLYRILVQAGEEDWAADLASELEGSEVSDVSLLGQRLLAELARDQGRLDEARWRYESFLETASSDDRWAVDNQYLEVLRDLGESDEVVGYLERRIDELGRQGWWQPREAYMAEQLEFLELHSLAVPYREQLLTKAPDNSAHRVAMGELLVKLERWDEAEGHFGRASQLAPDDVYIAQSVAEFHVERGQGAKALEVLEPFAGQIDLPVGLRLAQSRALEETGRLEEAEAVLADLLADRPNYHEARLELARLYDESGNTAKARHHYEEFVAATASLIDGAGNCECNCDLIAQRAEIVQMLEETRPDSVPAEPRKALLSLLAELTELDL
ncbi:MAG: tetratricopeptide repeat protein [Thermoanaerobaculia bacterium]